MGLPITKVKQNELGTVFQNIMGGTEEDTQAMQEALLAFKQHIVDEINDDANRLQLSQDKTVLAQRGYRQLTNEEEKWYQGFIEASKSRSAKQEFADFLNSPEGIMPETIIEDVFKDLREEHPLLDKINFTHTKFLTKWVLNDHTRDTAAWGELNSEIGKEITSAFRIKDISQNKLSAFAAIPKDMLELGPIFIDKYIREVLREALSCGLEKAIIDGTGKNEPIGLNRNVSEGVTVTGGIYPKKDAIPVTSFSPEEYGNLLSMLVVNEKGRMRKVGQVTLICNQADYLKKIMPATTIQNVSGEYKNNLFPHPTAVVISNYIPEGEAILCLAEEYFMGIGGQKEGIIEYSDDYKFLEDMRYYKIKTFGDGKAFDNTVSLVLDISNLNPAYITVSTQSKESLPSPTSRKAK